jgi:hypothetical protein
MVTFDWSISISDIVMVGGLLYGLIKARDAFRDLAQLVGTRHPPAGLVGDVARLDQQVKRHHGWLLVMRDKLGFKVDGQHGE